MSHQHDQDLDQAAHALAAHFHPIAQAQTGARGHAPGPDKLAADIRPHLTPEFMALVSGEPEAAPGAPKKPFNLAKFLENFNKILAVAGPIIGIITGVPIPPITIPTGGTSDPAGA